jgi:serine/threonine-protein kinase
VAGKVIFEATKGSLLGRVFPHEEKTSVFIGRQEDRGIVVTENTVSRYRCALEITPPEVRPQDFGSFNGTFLNGEKIGRRDRGRPGDEAGDEHLLHDGDVLRPGSKCKFKISVREIQKCAGRGAGLPAASSGDESAYWQIIVTEPAAPVRQRDPDAPEGLAGVVDRALREEPSTGRKEAAPPRRDIIWALPDKAGKAVVADAPA